MPPVCISGKGVLFSYFLTLMLLPLRVCHPSNLFLFYFLNILGCHLADSHWIFKKMFIMSYVLFKELEI